MAGTGSKIKSLKKAKQQIAKLTTQMKNYSNYIDSISSNLNAMMKGNGVDSYWQGETAVAWYNTAIGSKGLKGLIANYENSYREFKQFAKKLDKANTKASLKGASKSAIKAQLAKCDGSVYTKGVPTNKNDKLIAALPGTVNADVSNDDQTKESYAKYRALKAALDNLISNTDKIIQQWNELANNTTGKMNSDAKTRSKAMSNRRKQFKALRDDLEAQYIGDMLFSD